MRGFNCPWRLRHADWLIVVAGLATLAAASGAGAAPITQPSTAESAVDDQFAQLGEIVVTAQRVQSTEAKTPISMDAIGGEELTKQGLVTVADLNGYAQNLNVQENYSGVQFTIRGVTNSNGSTLNDPAVAFMLDGIYIPRETTPMYLGFYDVDRVEVLRGPQGTLYGRNSTGGVVNVISNTPKLNSFDFSGMASVGNYGATEDQLMVNLPVTERFALRAALSYGRRDSYLNKTSSDPFSMNPAKDNISGRLSALWKVTDDVTLGDCAVRLGCAGARDRGDAALFEHDFVLSNGGAGGRRLDRGDGKVRCGRLAGPGRALAGDRHCVGSSTVSAVVGSARF